MKQHIFDNGSSFTLDAGEAASQQTRDGLMGVMLSLSLASFAVAFGWIVSDFSNPFFQLGLLLLTFLSVSATGILYFLNPSRFLTFFLIGLVYFSFEATIRPGGGGGDLQSMVKGIFTVALTFLGLFTGMRFVFKSPLALVFFAYAAFALVSASYSPLVLVGAVAGIALIGVAIMAAKVGGGEERDIAGYWVAMYWASVLTALASLAIFAISPTLARDLADPSKYRLRGITGTANSLGPLMAAGCLIALFMLRRAATTWRWRFHAFMLAAFFAILMLTNSRSSILGLVTAMFTSWLVAGQIGVLGVLIGLLGVTVLAVVLLYPGLQDALLSLLAGLFARSGNVSELTTFTGRQQIWDASWHLAHEAPWFGQRECGAAAGSRRRMGQHGGDCPQFLS
jgi:O-antigen ligase